MPPAVGFLKTLLPLVLIMTLLSACAKAGPQPYSVLEQGSAAMTTEDFTFAVAADQASWQDLYQRIHAHRLPAPQVPQIDWYRELVAFVAAGWKPSSGYQVNVSRVEHQGERLQVFVQVHEPPADSVLLTVMTQPYVLVRIERPQSLGVVEFIDADGKILHSLEAALP